MSDVMPLRRTASADDARGLLGERASGEGLLLALLGQHAMRRLRAAHTEHKLSPRQFHLLGLLHDRGALTQRELGRLMDVDPSILVTLSTRSTPTVTSPANATQLTGAGTSSPSREAVNENSNAPHKHNGTSKTSSSPA